MVPGAVVAIIKPHPKDVNGRLIIEFYKDSVLQNAVAADSVEMKTTGTRNWNQTWEDSSSTSGG